MGIAGAGNSGTVLAALRTPSRRASWLATGLRTGDDPDLHHPRHVLPARQDSPNHHPPPPLRSYLRSIQRRETLWFCLFYGVTFGGFVGLSSYLSIFFRDEYGVSRVAAGDLTAAAVVAGSLFRPIGGAISDRVGGLKVLTGLFVVVAVLLLVIAALPPLWLLLPVLVLAMGALGMGNGAVFQVIPQVFQREIGVITGLVGAAGGIGGFYLPTVLGALKETTGSFGPGFAAFSAVAMLAVILLVVVRGRITVASPTSKRLTAEASR